MDLGILTDNKLVSLALHGYGPFQPEVGIFCGGYQGILYPQPTTLSYPGFDPYLNKEPTPTEFTPNKTYTGLGVGNPGIDYTNPGHILGIFDTFGRMSYGIGVLQAIAEGRDGFTLIGPAIELVLPLVFNSDFSDASIGLGNIYPSLSETPSAYINHFSIGDDGRVIPDPRGGAALPNIGAGFSPISSVVDDTVMKKLFVNKSIFSYLGMPQYFRAAIDALATSALSLTTKSTHTFSLNNDEDFSRYSGLDFFQDRIDDPWFIINRKGSVVSKCEVMDATQALKTLTNSSVYHDGADGQNDYRSLTELNSVINLVPLQMIGATYQKHYIENLINNKSIPEGGLTFLIASYAIFDFVINVSDIPPDPNNPSPGNISINGTITVKNLINDTTPYHWEQITQSMPVPASNILIPGWVPNTGDGSLTDIIYGTVEGVKKSAIVQISSRNNVSWDKQWLGGEPINVDSGFFDTKDVNTDDSFTDPLDDTPLILPFEQTVELGRGNTSIRVRVIAKSSHFVRSNLLGLFWEDPNNSNGPNGTMPEAPESCGEHLIFDHFRWVLDWHCHPYLGILNNFFLGDPMTIEDNIQEEAFNLSLTVDGTRLSPISYEISN